eukprot:877140-Pyramimonas_sp.AAC.1
MVRRHLRETRCPNLCNVDNRAIPCAANMVWARSARDAVHPSSRGFSSGRKMQDNSYDIDWFGVICCVLGAMCPALAIIEIQAALPSLICSWIFFVLETVRLLGLYCRSCVSFIRAAVLSFGCQNRCEVLQPTGRPP